MGRLGRLTLPVAILGLLLAVPAGAAEPIQSQKINFNSYDGVFLVGNYWPSTQKTSGPCVLLIHRLGGNRTEKGWDTLAEELQGKGFAVLSFDLRGHGDSTTVKNTFWNAAANMRGIRGANAKKEKIEFKEFLPSYYPMLANDIAAAKVELHKRNNQRECNVKSTFIVAEEDGAALASLWVATEYQRRRPLYNTQGFFTGYSDPYGKDIAAAVWLSFRPKLGKAGATMPVNTWFAKPEIREGVPMCFLYGQQDTTSGYFAKMLYDKVLQADNPRAKLKLTYKGELPKTKLSGHDLLAKSDLATESHITEYMLKLVLATRPVPTWEDCEMKNYPLSPVRFDKVGVSVP